MLLDRNADLVSHLDHDLAELFVGIGREAEGEARLAHGLAVRIALRLRDSVGRTFMDDRASECEFVSGQNDIPDFRVLDADQERQPDKSGDYAYEPARCLRHAL